LPTLPLSRLASSSSSSSSVLPDISLSPEQELSALTAFMAALPQNVIPTNIDPAQPIDPQLVLDFDTRSPQAEQEIDDLVIDVWIGNPVVLFSKVTSTPRPPPLFILACVALTYHGQLHSSASRELKSILSDMDLQPPPTIFDVDQRGTPSVPMRRNLFIND
jgi:hypothetical protein